MMVEPKQPSLNGRKEKYDGIVRGLEGMEDVRIKIIVRLLRFRYRNAASVTE